MPSVILTWLCPSISCTTFGCTPALKLVVSDYRTVSNRPAGTGGSGGIRHSSRSTVPRDLGGVGVPVPAGDSDPANRRRRRDAEEPREQSGGKLATEVSKGGPAILDRLDADAAEALAELRCGERPS